MFKCLEASDCHKVMGKSVTECAKSNKGLDTKCVGLVSTYKNCKRQQLDMRSRIRGVKGY